MVQWNFNLLLKNYGTMEKTMILRKIPWFYTENYETLIFQGKNTVDKQKLRILDS